MKDIKRTITPTIVLHHRPKTKEWCWRASTVEKLNKTGLSWRPLELMLFSINNPTVLINSF